MKGLLDFLSHLGRLKEIPRTGWLEAGIEEPESVADHSFRTAVLAMLLADLQGLDSGKAAKMALLHDIAEAITGDLTPEGKRRRSPDHKTEEAEAMNRIMSGLPREIAASYNELWDELQKSSSQEARVVSQADKVDMLLQAQEYERGGGDPARFGRFWHSMIGEGTASCLLNEIRRRRKS